MLIPIYDIILYFNGFHNYFNHLINLQIDVRSDKGWMSKIFKNEIPKSNVDGVTYILLLLVFIN